MNAWPGQQAGRLPRAGLGAIALVVAPTLVLTFSSGRVAAAPGAPASGVISTVAGGPGGPGAGRGVGITPCGVAAGSGRLYVADGLSVRRAVQTTGALAVVAGTGSSGPVGVGGLATKAALSTCGVAVDQAGNLLIADVGNDLIRAVATHPGTFYGQKMTGGHIYTVAGDGKQGFTGDRDRATDADLDSPSAVAADQSGNLVIADAGNERIRVVATHPGTFYGQKMTGGHIYTVAGDGKQGFTGDRDRATDADLDSPSAVAADQSGNLVIADAGNERIRVVAVRRGTFYGQRMTAGHIYTVAGNGGFGYSGDQDRATKAQFSDPDDVVVDGAGNLVVADSDNDRVRVVANRTGTFYGRRMTAGDVYTVAGDGRGGFTRDGGLATKSRLADPDGVAVDHSGNLVIADAGNDRVRVVANRTGTFYRQPMKAGRLYTVTGDGEAGRSGDGGPAAAAELGNPGDLIIDGAGNLVIADTGNNRIQVVAARSGTFYGRVMTTGDVYTIAGQGEAGSAGDGGLAAAARFNAPFGVAVDAAGNVLVADSGNNRVQVVAAARGTFYGQSMIGGHMYTIAGNGQQGYTGDRGPATAAELTSCFGVAIDAAGNVLIADTGNEVIRAVAVHTGTYYGQAMTTGHIYTIAGNGAAGFGGDGGLATAGQMRSPFGVATDLAGDLVIADTGDNRVRVVAAQTGTSFGQAMLAGHIYTIAGNGSEGFNGGGGPGQQAEMDTPEGVTVDQAGNVLVADTLNSRIRVIAARTGTSYGVAMTVGHIYTVAGNGTRGYSGDGGPAVFAGLHDPGGVITDSAGDVFIADALNNRVREVTG